MSTHHTSSLLAHAINPDRLDVIRSARATGTRTERVSTYRIDSTMNYEHNSVVTQTVDLEPIIQRLLSESDVATVHVRTLAP